MKNLFILAAFVATFAMLLASCSSTSTEAPTCTSITTVDTPSVGSIAVDSITK